MNASKTLRMVFLCKCLDGFLYFMEKVPIYFLQKTFFSVFPLNRLNHICGVHTATWRVNFCFSNKFRLVLVLGATEIFNCNLALTMNISRLSGNLDPNKSSNGLVLAKRYLLFSEALLQVLCSSHRFNLSLYDHLFIHIAEINLLKNCNL
jgi:hypothetical protein